MKRKYWIHRLLPPLQRILNDQRLAGLVLLLAGAVALMWVNSPWKDLYHSMNETPLTFHLGSISVCRSLNVWINDGLMALFFFVVGLEIKNQRVRGELSDRRKALLPTAAALGGMVVPAMIYWLFNAGHPQSAPGWGIPVATDIAFALGVLALLGSRIPPALRIFLLTLATVDDVGGILVIAGFYSSKIFWPALLAAGALALSIQILNKSNVRHAAAYLMAGVALWVAMFTSGINPTIAGVILGLLMPAREHAKALAPPSEPLSERMLRIFSPWVNWLVLPIFALSNSGIELSSSLFRLAVDHPAAGGIYVGLLFGKFIGTLSFSWLAVKLKIADLPSQVKWTHLMGTSILTGIGFTVSLFITQLAFKDAVLISVAKVAVLSASLTAAVAGFVFLRFTAAPAPRSR